MKFFSSLLNPLIISTTQTYYVHDSHLYFAKCQRVQLQQRYQEKQQSDLRLLKLHILLNFWTQCLGCESE